MRQRHRSHLLAGVFFSPSAFLRDGEIDEDIWDEGVDIPFAAHGRDATVSIWRWYGLSSLLCLPDGTVSSGATARRRSALGRLGGISDAVNKVTLRHNSL